MGCRDQKPSSAKAEGLAPGAQLKLWPPCRTPTLRDSGSHPCREDTPQGMTRLLTMMMYQLLTTVSSNKVTAKGREKEKHFDQTYF